VIERN
jgi:hypothetical protein